MIKISSQAPRWAQELARDLDQSLSQMEDHQLLAFNDTASLPDPALKPRAMVFNEALGTVVVSTGTAWQRLDTGALL